MQHIQVEYNKQWKPLETVLAGVRQPGDYFVCGSMEMPMPRIEVKGVGTLSFPVPEAQIAALVQRAEQAPYGKGEETVVDTSVRKVWQISNHQVNIGGKSWAANFETVVSKVMAGLGGEGASVSAELYKLLVYDRGGFFLAHRDTEKAEGMFGTLVVTLPSTYRGGALRIRHAGREVTLDTNATDPSELSYAAFYADCEHEVLPVRTGSRVCLIYNLIQKRSTGRQRTLKAPEYDSQIAEVAAILSGFLEAPDSPAKIAWLLEHQYSPAGLSFAALKGADAARARVLLQAAARAQCAAHLAIVHLGESGAAEPEYDDYRYRSRRHPYRRNGVEEEDESFTAVTVDGAWQYVDEWRDAEDRVVEYGRIPLASGELLPAGALDGEPPDEKRLTEASGNEGATYERSYHRAALVIWRENRTADVLLQCGVVAALPHLRRLAGSGRSVRAEAIAVAERVLEAWPRGKERWRSHSIGRTWPGPEERVLMITTLAELRAPALLDRFLTEVVAANFDGSENAALLASVNLLGVARAVAALATLMAARMRNRPGECAKLLLAMSAEPSLRFPEVAEAAVAHLDLIGTRDANSTVLDWAMEDRRALGPEFLEHLLLGVERIKGSSLSVAVAEKIAARPEVFSPVTLVAPAIERLCRGRKSKTATVDSSIQYLWTSAAGFLLQRSEFSPQLPSDWRMLFDSKCRCADCRELVRFARDPVASVHRFRMNKERRRHLHGVIESHQLDMTHVTERVGSPQTLVCTKDRRTFVRRMKQYQDEIAAMRTLVKLAPVCGGPADLTRRLEDAVRRGG